jgi:hypothetical protein
MKLIINKIKILRENVVFIVILWILLSILFTVLEIQKYYSPITFYASDLPSQTGIAEGYRRIASEENKDHQGYLIIGPYINIYRGSYKIELFYNSNNTDAIWEICFNFGRKSVTKEIPLKNGQVREKIHISEEYSQYSVMSRLLYRGKGTLEIEKVIVEREKNIIYLSAKNMLIVLVIIFITSVLIILFHTLIKSSLTEKILFSSMIVFLLLMFAMLLFYNFYTYRLVFNSDDGSPCLLSEEIIKKHSWFPEGWNYSAFLPVPFLYFSYTLNLILTPFFKDKFLCYTISLLGETVLFLFLSLLLLNHMARKKITFFIYLSIILSGISICFTRYHYGCHVGKTHVFTLLLTIIMVIFFILKNNTKYSKYYICLFIAFFYAFFDPGYNFTVTMPVLLSFSTFFILHKEYFHDKRKIINISFVIAMAFFMAKIIYIILIEHINYRPYTGSFVSSETLQNKFSFLFLSYLYIFGSLPDPLIPPMSLEGILMGYKFFLFSFIFILPFYLIFKLKTIECHFFRFILIFHVINTVLTMYFYTFGSLVPEGLILSRYLIITVIFSVIVFTIFMEKFILDRYNNRIISLLLIIFLFLPSLCSSFCIYVKPYGQFVRMDNEEIKFIPYYNKYDEICKFLLDNNITYGYSTFCNANVTTVLSGNSSRINGVIIKNGLPVPFRWLSSDDWYRPGNFKGKTCLILDDNELQLISMEKLTVILGNPEEIYKISDFNIFLYGFNIASRFPDLQTKNVKFRDRE